MTFSHAPALPKTGPYQSQHRTAPNLTLLPLSEATLSSTLWLYHLGLRVAELSHPLLCLLVVPSRPRRCFTFPQLLLLY